MGPAIHVDPQGQVREEFRFFGHGSAKMFGSMHFPRGAVRAGVLICSPFQSEFLVNYRREVLLGRALAARGLAVGRFHYRGTGHSDGEGRHVTFATMREDAEEAATWLRDSAGVEDLGFFGTRWGALVAASVSAERAGAPLAIWDPAYDGTRYFEEVFRFRRMSQLSGGRAGLSRSPLDEIREAGYADVFGFTIDRAIFESSRGRKLAVELGSTPRPVLLLQVNPGSHLKSEYRDLVDIWEKSGFSVDVRLIPGEEAWWFPGTQWRESALERTEVMVASTAEWFSERLAAISR